MLADAAVVVRAVAAVAVDKAATGKVVIVVKARVLDPPRAPRQHPVRRRRPHRVRQPAARRVDARVVISQPVTIHSDAAGAAIRLTVGINSDEVVRAAARAGAERTAVADSDEAVGAEAGGVAIKRLCSIASKTCRPTNRNSSSIG